MIVVVVLSGDDRVVEEERDWDGDLEWVGLVGLVLATATCSLESSGCFSWLALDALLLFEAVERDGIVG